ncbi:D-glucuronyl C5-epimerase family protein [Nocardioides massiliensis]|uniref:D-glucuronyl C5-epimerase C-terminal domain-containing protein n=1 Tax=Nocardioides massiliensis TaxID=1325935 RepID=A0ABT9NN02_9ACTN|nr:D-glucuronyl C5-epimerase family protein [Nocardioides massiliensis]MDP9821627.1 hypothetical protein [Nocardioides massiliensis]
MRPTSRLVPVLTAAVTSALLLGSCGEATDEPTAPGAAATAGQAPAPEDVTEVDVDVKPVDGDPVGEIAEGERWRTSGYTLADVDARPYDDQVLLEGLLDAEVDADGIRIFERHDRRWDHPVAIAQYAMAQLDAGRDGGDADRMARAIANGEKLLTMAEPVGDADYYPYPFDFPLGGRVEHTLPTPWWSAMAQGQVLSLFVRLFEETGEQRWRDAADRTFRSLDDEGPREQPWSAYVDPEGYFWFEEYAGELEPLLVLNGHMFAMFGVWDYWNLTGSEQAVELFDAGATTLAYYLPAFREPQGVSWYCIRMPLCGEESWQNEKYHGIVTTQMRFVADMVDAEEFDQFADQFAADFVPAPEG